MSTSRIAHLEAVIADLETQLEKEKTERDFLYGARRCPKDITTIRKLQAQLEKLREQLKGADYCEDLAVKRYQRAEAQLDKVRPYLKHTRDCPQPTAGNIDLSSIGINTFCSCGLQAILEKE